MSDMSDSSKPMKTMVSIISQIALSLIISSVHCTIDHLSRVHRDSLYSQQLWQTRGDKKNAPPALTNCHKDNRDRMERCIDNAFDSWRYYEIVGHASEKQL